MNTLNIAEVISHPEDVASLKSTALDRPSSPARTAIRRVQLRHALLLCIVAMLAWFAFSVHSAIDRLDAEMDMIRTNLLLPL